MCYNNWDFNANFGFLCSFWRLLNHKFEKKRAMFSKTTEYGIRAAIFVASESHQNKRSGLKDIAKKIDSPEAFTAKIMQILTKNKLIDSVKGVGGGFEIPTERLSQIKLSQIVNALEGDRVFKGCGLGLSNCSEEHPCPMHDKFKSIRNDLSNMLENTTLEELTLGLKTGDTFLRY